jgi:hypothetical protein
MRLTEQVEEVAFCLNHLREECSTTKIYFLTVLETVRPGLLVMTPFLACTQPPFYYKEGRNGEEGRKGGRKGDGEIEREKVTFEVSSDKVTNAMTVYPH